VYWQSVLFISVMVYTSAASLVEDGSYCVCLCVCVCVRERERERDRKVKESLCGLKLCPRVQSVLEYY
jgi:hypothetical protein